MVNLRRGIEGDKKPLHFKNKNIIFLIKFNTKKW